MTPTEALQHVIDMSTDGTEAVSDLRILGFAVAPIEPDAAAIERVREAIAEARGGWEPVCRAAYDAVIIACTPPVEDAGKELRARVLAVVPIKPDAATIERIAIITCSGQWGDLTDEQRETELIVARAAYAAIIGLTNSMERADPPC